MNQSDYDKLFHIDLLDGAQFAGKYQFPVIEMTSSVPQNLIPFDKAVSTAKHDRWVHFFINDRSFIRIWNRPYKYLPKLLQYRGAFAPDFSIMHRYPLHLQIQSVARSRTIGSWLQRAGIDVIPVVRWGKEETYEFAFDAIVPGGTVGVGTLGCTLNSELRDIFSRGLPVMLERLEPKTLVVYGPLREDVFNPAIISNVIIVHFASETTLIKAGMTHGAE